MNRLFLFVWIATIVLVVYSLFVLRYYYRIPQADEDITILQCTSDTFKSELLRERMPVVCRGVGALEVFKKVNTELRGSTSGIVSRQLSNTIYSSLRVPSWFCDTDSIRVRSDPIKSVARATGDVNLHVQVEGSTQIALWVPVIDCDESQLRRIDIRLSAGDGLFIPFQWWYQVLEAQEVKTNEVPRWCELRWVNRVLTQNFTKGTFGACEHFPSKNES